MMPTGDVRALVAAFVILSCALNSSQAEEPTWTPPVSEPQSLDWIRLKSGEWLRGKVTGLRDKALSFDSEELDELELDWDNVSELRSPRILTYGFEKKVTATGTSRMKDGVIKIRDRDGEVQEFAHADVLGIIEGALSELNFWSAKASLGLVVRSGNTDQSDLNTIATLRRETTRSRISFDYNGKFGKLDGELNINNHRGSGKWDVIVGHGFFVIPLNVELYTDKFTNIDIRTTLSAGAGYFLIRTKDLEWQIQLGSGYQRTDFVSVQPGEPERQETGSLIPAMKIEADITSDIEFDFNYDAKIGVPDAKEASHNLLSQLSVDFWKYFDLVFSITWNRVETPRPDAEGVVPKRDDLQTTFGFGIDI
jgi:putative salt-induced outer membrane protein YdiY